MVYKVDEPENSDGEMEFLGNNYITVSSAPVKYRLCDQCESW